SLFTFRLAGGSVWVVRPLRSLRMDSVTDRPVGSFDFATPLRRSWRYFVPIWLVPLGLYLGDIFSAKLPFLGPLSMAAMVFAFGLTLVPWFRRHVGVLPLLVYNTAFPTVIWYLLCLIGRAFHVAA